MLMRFKQFFLALWMICLIFLLAGCLESGEQPILMSLTITPFAENIEVSQTAMFTAVGIDQNGNEITITPTWTVTNNIGIVTPTNDSSIRFTATKAGIGKLTATAGAKTASITITVTQTLATIEFSTTNLTLFENETTTLTAIGRDRFKNQMEITPIWSISEEIGTITPTSGSKVTFTATTPGSGKIIARLDDVSGEVSITVQEKPVLSTITITPATPQKLYQGETCDFTATGLDQYGNTFEIMPVWTLTHEIGTIAPQEGMQTTFTAAVIGTSTLVATVGNISTSVEVIVQESPEVTTLKMDPASVQMMVTNQQTFTVSGHDQYGNPISVQPIWSVTNEIGSIQAGENGTAIFTAANVTNIATGVVQASVGSLNVSASVTIFPKVKKIDITPATATLQVGDTTDFTITVLDETDTEIPIMPTHNITNQIGSIIYEDTNTLCFKAEQVGTGALILTIGNISRSVDIIVNPAQ